MSRFFACAVAVSALWTGACGDSGNDDQAKKPEPTTPMRDRVESYTIDSDVRISVSGATEASHAGTMPMKVLRVIDPERDLRILTVGTADPVTDASGLVIQESYANLVDFEKDGTYTITTTAGGAAPANNAYVILLRRGADGKPTEAARYDVPRQPCTVDIERQGDAGKLVCPELADTAGRVVRLELVWKGTGSRQTSTPSTGPLPTPTTLP